MGANSNDKPEEVNPGHFGSTCLDGEWKGAGWSRMVETIEKHQKSLVREDEVSLNAVFRRVTRLSAGCDGIISVAMLVWQRPP